MSNLDRVISDSARSQKPFVVGSSKLLRVPELK